MLPWIEMWKYYQQNKSRQAESRTENIWHSRPYTRSHHHGARGHRLARKHHVGRSRACFDK